MYLDKNWGIRCIHDKVPVPFTGFELPLNDMQKCDLKKTAAVYFFGRTFEKKINDSETGSPDLPLYLDALSIQRNQPGKMSIIIFL